MNKITTIPVGEKSYPTNCYLLYNEKKEGIVIDPGFNSDEIQKQVKIAGVDVKYVVLTHAHADHLGQLKKILDATGAIAMIHEADYSEMLKDEKAYYSMLNVNVPDIVHSKVQKLKHGDKICLEGLELEVIHTPGHTSGCICLYLETDHVLFTGDTLFYNCHGRCDLYTGSLNDMKKSLDYLFQTFHNVQIYPGHEENCQIAFSEKRVKLLMKIKGE